LQCSIQSDLHQATKLIIPGVGAFGAAIARLARLKDEIRAFAQAGNPVMGICLGMQLLLEKSEEHGEHEGLGLIPGSVKYLPSDKGLKVPHMGWSPVSFRHGAELGEGIHEGDRVFFVHSLYAECSEVADVAGTTDYGVRFASAIQRGNVWGTQFHPEKSGAVGLRILRNFLAC
jgi:glutamine amidotransferase